MAVPFGAGWDQASDSIHDDWMDRQRREERAREINLQRDQSRFRYDVADNLRQPVTPVPGLRRGAEMPAPIPAPVDPSTVVPSVPSGDTPVAPSAGLKTTRQSYEATANRAVYRAENMPLPPAIPLEQMTPAQRAAYARYANTAIRSNQAPAVPSEGRGDGSARSLAFNNALRLGAVSVDNVDISGSPYDAPAIPLPQMTTEQRALYAQYVRLASGNHANPTAVARARAAAENAGVFSKNTPQGYTPVSPQTPASRTRTLPADQNAPQATAQPTSFTPQAAGASLDTRNPQDVARIAQVIGVQPGSGYRSPQEQQSLVDRGIGASATSLHPHGRAIDFPLSGFPQGWTLQQAGQYVQQQWQRGGLPQAEFIFTEHGTGPHVHVEWGGQSQSAPTGAAPQSPGATVQAAAPALQRIYQSVTRSPEGLPFTVQQAQETYDQNAVIFQAAQRAGLPDQMIAAANAMREANTQAISALGYQAAMDIIQSGNTARAEDYFGILSGGAEIRFQPFSDGTLSYSVDGVEQGRGTREEVAGEIMSLVNSEYLEAQREAQQEQQQALFESGLRMREDAFSQQLEGQRDITLEAFRAELERQRIDPQTVRPVELANGGRGVIYQTPDGRIILREFRETEQRGPSTNGRGDSQTVATLGPEMDITDSQ